MLAPQFPIGVPDFFGSSLLPTLVLFGSLPALPLGAVLADARACSALGTALAASTAGLWCQWGPVGVVLALPLLALPLALGGGAGVLCRFTREWRMAMKA